MATPSPLFVRAAPLDGRALTRATLALGMPFVALGLALLSSELTRAHPFLFFYPAVLVSAALGGRWLGLLACGISALMVSMFLLPPPFTSHAWLALGVFLAVGVAFVGVQQRLTQARADKAERLATIQRDLAELSAMQARLERVNEEVVEAREFLENVLESSTEYSIIAKDLERRILGWNAGARRNYGYTPQEIIGRSSDVLHTADEVRRGAVAALHRQALEEGKATGLFHRRRKDGSEFLARVVITRRSDAKGNPVGYLLVSHDVTAEQLHLERQRFLAEVSEALQASLDYRATLTRLAKLVVGFLGDGCRVDVLERASPLERTWVVEASPEHADLTTALERLNPDHCRLTDEMRSEGRPRLFSQLSPEALGAMMRDSSRRPELEALYGAATLFAPIMLREEPIAFLTVVSRQGARALDLNDLSLTEELARRTALALDNARLYELARQAIQARDQVLGVVAHDLRNPLSAVLVAAALVEQRSVDESLRAPVATIERAARRMNRLISDLLDVTRIEAQGLSLETAPVYAAQAVRDAVEAERPLAEAASLELDVELEPNLPEVLADRDRLQQIFENLIGNAIKFTPAPGRVVVGATKRARDVLFFVKDSGLGVDPEHLPHLFDRFWQGDAQRRRGAGLGLPIVKGLVLAHRGEIWVESTLGQGTSFFFTLPSASSPGGA